MLVLQEAANRELISVDAEHLKRQAVINHAKLLRQSLVWKWSSFFINLLYMHVWTSVTRITGHLLTAHSGCSESHFLCPKGSSQTYETHKYTHHSNHQRAKTSTLALCSWSRWKQWNIISTWCFNRTHISFKLSRKGNRLLLGLPGMLHGTKGKVGRDLNLTRDTVQTQWMKPGLDSLTNFQNCVCAVVCSISAPQ